MLGLFLSGMGPTSFELANPTAINTLSKESVKSIFKEMASRTYSSAKNFGIIGGLFSGIECTIESYRGRHDIYNSALAGCTTGALLGARCK